MKIWLAAFAMVVTTAAPSLTGTWTMNVTGGPHGDATMGLTLQQDGTKVTGTFVSGHSADMPVSGEFKDGTLKLQTQADKDGNAVIFEAKLRDDGTLAGYISSPVGDMKWTATRADVKKGKDR
jgi:hypothetical protein